MNDNDWSDLEIFTSNSSSCRSQGLYIYILKNTLRLSPACFTYIDLNNFVKLYYSRIKDCIVLKITDKQDKNTRLISRQPINKNKNKYYGIISTIQFFKRFNIDSAKYPTPIQLVIENIPDIGECFVAYLSTK